MPRYPIRARRRPLRKGLFRSVFVVGGAYTPPVEYVDSATVYLDLTVTTTDVADYVDSATVYLDLTVSATETADFVDSAEVYLDLQASGTEIHEKVDAAEVYLNLTVAEIAPFFPTTEILDTFTRADQNPITGNWSTPTGGTAANDIQLVSNVIAGTVADFNNAWWNPTTYGPDCEAYVTIGVPIGASCSVLARIQQPGSSATIDGYLATTDGTSVRLGRYINGGWSQIGSSFGIALDTGDKIGIRCINSQIELWTYSSGSWTRRISTTDDSISAAGYIGVEINGTIATFDDFGGGTYVPATEHAQFVDSATVYLLLTPSATDVADFVDAATVPFTLTPSTTVEEHTTYDAAEVYLDLTASGTEVQEREYLDSAEVYLELSVTSVESTDYSDTETIYFDISITTSDIAEFTDAATVPLALVPSSVDVADFVDSTEVYFDLQPSGVDEYTSGGGGGTEYIDSAEVYLDISLQSVDVSEFIDTAQVYLDLQPSSVDTAEYVDSTTVPLLLTITSSEEFTYTDSATVYFDLQVILFIAPTMSLYVAGATFRWAHTGYKRYEALTGARRYAFK